MAVSIYYLYNFRFVEAVADDDFHIAFVAVEVSDECGEFVFLKRYLRELLFTYFPVLVQ